MHGLKSASVFWPGSEAVIDGMQPNMYYKFNNSWSNAYRLERVIQLARLPVGQRPNLITAYLSKLDELGHMYGPNSHQVNNELLDIDSLIRQLSDVIVGQMNGNLVIVSDHGMVELPRDHHMLLEDWLPDYEKMLLFVDFWTVCSLIPRAEHFDAVLEGLRFGEASGAPFKVYTSDTLPLEWNYYNNDRIAPIIIQCDKVQLLLTILYI